ncbi:hypothetical protein [Azospirillum palustre]
MSEESQQQPESVTVSATVDAVMGYRPEVAYREGAAERLEAEIKSAFLKADVVLDRIISAFADEERGCERTPVPTPKAPHTWAWVNHVNEQLDRRAAETIGATEQQAAPEMVALGTTGDVIAAPVLETLTGSVGVDAVEVAPDSIPTDEAHLRTAHDAIEALLGCAARLRVLDRLEPDTHAKATGALADLKARLGLWPPHRCEIVAMQNEVSPDRLREYVRAAMRARLADGHICPHGAEDRVMARIEIMRALPPHEISMADISKFLLDEEEAVREADAFAAEQNAAHASHDAQIAAFRDRLLCRMMLTRYNPDVPGKYAEHNATEEAARASIISAVRSVLDSAAAIRAAG